MTKFIFVRHGESTANKAMTLGEFGTKLTEEGIEQARVTGQALKDKAIKVVACSTFIRAQQTAETIAAELGIDIAHIKVLDGLGERRLGTIEGQPREHESEWYQTAEDPGMEPLQDVLDRSHVVLDQLKKLSQEGLVLVVGHAVSGFYLLLAAKGVTNTKDIQSVAQMANAAFTEVEII